jgi:hypothetical protein
VVNYGRWLAPVIGGVLWPILSATLSRARER